MNEEKFLRDGVLFFNAPPDGMVKPTTIYYDPNADTSGIEYLKPNEKKQTQKTTWFKVVMSLTTTAIFASLIYIIYFFVTRTKREPELKVVHEEGSHEEQVVPETPVSEENWVQKYFKSLVFNK